MIICLFESSLRLLSVWAWALTLPRGQRRPHTAIHIQQENITPDNCEDLQRVITPLKCIANI